MRPPARFEHAYHPDVPDAARYLPLVRTLADRLRWRLPQSVEREDLIGAGVVGLMEAITRYDPAQADKFEGFLACRIRGAMLDELRRRDLMARDARAESKRIEQTMIDLMMRLGRAPEDEELASALGVEVASLHRKLERLAPVRVGSLDEDLASDEQDPLANTLASERRTRLAAAILHLSARSQSILHLYYREELTLKDIGSVIGVTESRVSQLLSAITLQLRALLRVEMDT